MTFLTKTFQDLKLRSHGGLTCSALALALTMAAPAAQADILGFNSDDGLGVKVDLGDLAKVDVNVGGKDELVSADAKVGGKDGIDLDADVLEHDSVADIDLSIGGRDGLSEDLIVLSDGDVLTSDTMQDGETILDLSALSGACGLSDLDALDCLGDGEILATDEDEDGVIGLNLSALDLSDITDDDNGGGGNGGGGGGGGGGGNGPDDDPRGPTTTTTTTIMTSGFPVYGISGNGSQRCDNGRGNDNGWDGLAVLDSSGRHMGTVHMALSNGSSVQAIRFAASPDFGMPLKCVAISNVGMQRSGGSVRLSVSSNAVFPRASM